MSWLNKIDKKIVDTYLNRIVSAPGIDSPPMLIENPIEEIAEARARGKDIMLYGASIEYGKARAALNSMARTTGDIRFEENFFFSTRRYPKAPDNNLGAVVGTHIPAGENLYFAAPVGTDGQVQGFPTGFTMSPAETNSDTPNSTPQGKGFKIWAEGIAFNSGADADDIAQVLDSGALKYQVQGGQFALRKGPLRGWPGGQGVMGFTAKQGEGLAANGIADPRAMRVLRFPRVIKPLQNFNYIHEVANQGLKSIDGTPWQLSKFTLASVMLWGHQLDAIPG